MSRATTQEDRADGSAAPGLQVVELSQVAAQPWRNGGGLTRELLAWPDAASWQVRVSVAEIEADGPFSAFPGVQRWFAVLQGAGVVLDLPDGPQRLSPLSPPFAFDGAQAPGCQLIAGPTRDLNLMARHGAGRATMGRAAPGHTQGPTARWRALFCLSTARLVRGNGPAQALPAQALAWSDTCSQPWQLLALQEPGTAWWLTLHDD
jgi:uncharacterized protein